MQTNDLALPDVFGNLVSKGDTVACIVPYYSCLTLCVVLKVTPKGFTVEYKKSNGYKETTNRHHADVAKRL